MSENDRRHDALWLSQGAVSVAQDAASTSISAALISVGIFLLSSDFQPVIFPQLQLMSVFICSPAADEIFGFLALTMLHCTDKLTKAVFRQP